MSSIAKVKTFLATFFIHFHHLMSYIRNFILPFPLPPLSSLSFFFFSPFFPSLLLSLSLSLSVYVYLLLVEKRKLQGEGTSFSSTVLGDRGPRNFLELAHGQHFDALECFQFVLLRERGKNERRKR